MRGNQSEHRYGQKKRTVCFFGSRSSQSVAIHFYSRLSRLERCLLVPVTSLFTPYRLAAHTHDVVRLWPLDPTMLYLYDGLHGFCLVCGRRCSSRHSRFYYPVSSGGLTAGVSCEEHREIGYGFGSLSCRVGTGNPLGSPAGSDWVQFIRMDLNTRKIIPTLKTLWTILVMKVRRIFYHDKAVMFFV